MKKLFSLLILFFLCNYVVGLAPGWTIVQAGAQGFMPKYLVNVNSERTSNFRDVNTSLREVFSIDRQITASLISTEQEERGNSHYKCRQLYNQIPIEGTMYTLHVDRDQRLTAINGDWFSNVSMETTPVLTPDDALAIALDNVKAERYKWEIPEEERDLQEKFGKSYRPTPTLVIIPKDDFSNALHLRLAYKFDIYVHEPLGRYEVFVDAMNGFILHILSRIEETDVSGTAVTAYNSSQTIIADFPGSPPYRLREATHGHGIETYNLHTGANYSASNDFLDADNYWNNVNPQKDEYATDAHWGTEQTYLFYWNTFARNSIDNNGLKLLNYVHYRTNYVNAFWDGIRMTYGDGDATHDPIVALDVVGHEITHGLTQYTANLVYEKEAGALNESFSDMMGTAIEFFSTPGSADWTIAEDIGSPFRDMSNPNAYGHPDTYNGIYYYSTDGCSPSSDNDYCNVHKNSGVSNFWFYLLANGGSGSNDLGNAYSVSGISLTSATAIAYRTLTVYLTPNSGFNDARFYSLLAASDLYGDCSPEYEATANAWYAVGVGSAFNAANASDGLRAWANEDCALFAWNTNGSSNFTLEYSVYGSGNWMTIPNIPANGSIVTTYEIVGLRDHTHYEWHVTNVCGGVVSPVSANSEFWTGTFCQYPIVYWTNDETACSVEISWPNLGSYGYTISYSLAGMNVWTDVSVYYPNFEFKDNFRNIKFTLTGLTPGTEYDYKVRSECSEVPGHFNLTSHFSTQPACSPVTNLNATPSTCVVDLIWDTESGAQYEVHWRQVGGAWSTYTVFTTVPYMRYYKTSLTASTSYEYYIVKNCSGTCSDSYTSPTYIVTTLPSAGICTTLPVLSAAWMETGVMMSWIPSNNATSYDIQYRFNSTGAWYVFNSWNYTNIMIGIPMSYFEFQIRSNCTCSGSSQSTWATYLYNPVPCGSRVVHTVENFFTTFVSLQWVPTNSTSSYNVRYRPVGSGVWTTQNPTGFRLDLPYASLQPAIQYEWQVQSNCTAGGTNPYSAMDYFTPPGVCPVPTGLNAGPITNTTATLNWNSCTGFPNLYNNVRYREIGTVSWITGNYIVNHCDITGLTPMTNYEFQVQTFCIGLFSTAYSASFYFSTPVRRSDPNLKTEIGNFDAYPNPFNDALNVSFELSSAKRISICILEPTGRKIADLVEGQLDEGLHSYIWKPTDEASGIYFILYTDGENTIRKKVMLLKN